MQETIKSWTTEGFNLTAKSEPDPDPELSWLGTYTRTEDEPTSGLVRHSKGIRVPPVVTRSGYLMGASEEIYFRPQEGCEEHWQEDEARLRDYYREQWWLIGVVVTASRCGVELAEASIWGVVNDSGDEEMQRIADELAAEVLVAAKEKVRELCAA